MGKKRVRFVKHLKRKNLKAGEREGRSVKTAENWMEGASGEVRAICTFIAR